MPQQRRRSMGLRASQRAHDGINEAVLIGSPIPTRSRSAERSSITTSSGSWDVVSQNNSNQSNLSKNDSGSESHCCLHRSNSDPFDDGGDELAQDSGPVGATDTSGVAEEGQVHVVKALPTLHRFPCTQTRNQNCWSESPPETFAVRGPNYMNGDKTKIQCTHYLLQARGCDLFLTKDSKNNDEIILQGGLGGNIRKKPTFLFRFLFPWGMLIQYYEVPPRLVPFMEMGNSNEARSESLEGLSNAEKALAKWLSSDDPEFKNERLKLIAIAPEGPWIVRNLVTGKPALIGKRLQVSYKYVPRKSNSMECLQMCDLDISSGTAIAKKTVNVTRRYLSSLKAVDIGFVIEGTSATELPEEMMGSTRMHHVDPTQAPSI